MSLLLLITFLKLLSEIKALQNGLVLIGDSFHLQCASSSSSQVCGAFQWSKKDVNGSDEAFTYGRVLINDFDGRYMMNASGIPCDVNINDVTVDDAGEFSCLSVDSGRQTAHLTVIEREPSCWTDANDTEVIEGDTVQVFCTLPRYHTSAEVEVSWEDQYNQEMLTAATNKRPNLIYSTFSLVARSPAVFPFTCRTSFQPKDDVRGLAQNAPFVTCSTPKLHVVYPVRNIRLKMNGTKLTPGKEVTCLAEGQPPPSYRWLVKPHDHFVFGSKVVIEPRKVYQCIAMNVVKGHYYKDESWEIYIREFDLQATTAATTTFVTSAATTPSSTSFTSSTKNSTTQQNFTIFVTSPVLVNNTEFKNNINGSLAVETEEPEEEPAETNNLDNRQSSRHSNSGINWSSVILGLLLIIAIIIILCLVVKIHRLKGSLQTVRLVSARRTTSAVAATTEAARQVMTPYEKVNGKSKPGSGYSSLSQEDFVPNGHAKCESANLNGSHIPT